jgi:dTDP-4-amino-4,6-dideoxygalactose transaminase
MSIHTERAYAPSDSAASAASGAALAATEAAGRETLMLPLFPDLREHEQDWIIERLAAAVLAQAA